MHLTKRNIDCFKEVVCRTMDVKGEYGKGLGRIVDNFMSTSFILLNIYKIICSHKQSVATHMNIKSA